MIECDPVVNDVVESVAWPALSARTPKTVVPFLKVTDPPGVPVVVDVTTAVKVTDAPKVEGLALGVKRGFRTGLIDLLSQHRRCAANEIGGSR